MGIRVAETPEVPREGENLSIAVPPSVRRKPPTVDMWTGLPEEVKVQILGHLEPIELVRCSVVSKPCLLRLFLACDLFACLGFSLRVQFK